MVGYFQFYFKNIFVRQLKSLSACLLEQQVKMSAYKRTFSLQNATFLVQKYILLKLTPPLSMLAFIRKFQLQLVFFFS